MGSLWVVAPVAPTGECLSLLKDIGEVEHLVLLVTRWSTRPSSGRSSASFLPLVSGRHPASTAPSGPLVSSQLHQPSRFRVDGVLPPLVER